jgi:nitroreductase
MADPPMLLILFTDMEVVQAGVGRVAERASLVDAGAAGENVLLAATALNLGSQFAMISVMAGIRTILELPEHCRVDLIIPIGHPPSPPKSVKASEKANLVYHNRYGTFL